MYSEKKNVKKKEVCILLLYAYNIDHKQTSPVSPLLACVKLATGGFLFSRSNNERENSQCKVLHDLLLFSINKNIFSST